MPSSAEPIPHNATQAGGSQAGRGQAKVQAPEAGGSAGGDQKGDQGKGKGASCCTTFLVVLQLVVLTH